MILNKGSEQKKDYRYYVIENADKHETYIEAGWKLHERSAYKEAIRCYKKGIELQEENSELWCKLGLTYHNLGKNKKALFCYKRAIEINRNNSEATYYLGFLLYQQKKYEKASVFLYRTIELQRNNSMAYLYLGKTLRKLGRSKEIRKLLDERLIETYPEVEEMIVIARGDCIRKTLRRKTEKSHSNALVKNFLTMIGAKNIACFGDSHRALFSKTKGIKCYNVGSGTIYQLTNENSRSRARRRILDHIKEIDPKETAIMLVFGEIDIMEHIHKNAYRKKQEIEDILDELTERYSEFTKDVKSKGYEVIVIGPTFSGADHNSYGTMEERNESLIRLNKKLEKRFCSEGTLFATISHLMINERYKSNLVLSNDARHIDNFPKGSKVFRSCIFSELIKKKIVYGELEYQKPRYYVTVLSKINNAENAKIITHGRVGKNLKYSDKDTLTKGNIILEFGDHIEISKVILERNGEFNKFGATKIVIELITNRGVELVAEIIRKMDNNRIALEFNEKIICRALNMRLSTSEGQTFGRIEKVLIE